MRSSHCDVLKGGKRKKAKKENFKDKTAASWVLNSIYRRWGCLGKKSHVVIWKRVEEEEEEKEEEDDDDDPTFPYALVSLPYIRTVVILSSWVIRTVQKKKGANLKYTRVRG